MTPGRHEPGTHEPGTHEPGRHEPGRHEPGRHRRAGTGGQAPAGKGQSVPLSLRLAVCCEIAMGITMGYMLVLML